MGKSLAEQIAALSEEDRAAALEGLDPASLLYDWDFMGRPEQIPPKDNSWAVALFLAGRGAGKTRSAAEWIREKAKDTSQGNLRFLLVGRTAADVRDVLVTGEALALDTLVPSPQFRGGFTTMKKLKRGDIIIGGDGNPCTVKSGFKTLYNRPCYKIYIDGLAEPITADAAHKWLVHRRVGTNSKSRFEPSTKVVTTEEMFNDLPSQYYIERTTVKGSENLPLPYDPYHYGRMLGRRPVAKRRTIVGAENRAILDQYRWTTEENRVKLLTGIIDGIQARPRPEGYTRFGVTRTPRLQAQIAQIASSLGWVAKTPTPVVINGSRNSYGIQYHTQWREESNRTRWHITHIERTESVPVRCISVDSPDNTFLITDRYIKTHNSGIVEISPPDEKPIYQPTNRKLIWPNGNIALCASADEPDSLRGVQAHYSWGDEVAAWRQTPDGAGMTAWDNLRVATRLGPHPQIMATTTPKRVPLLYKLLKEQEEKGTVWVTRGSTFDNAGNLAGSYLDNILGTYDGTALAAQELFGEMLNQTDGALWSDEIIKASWEDDALPPYTPLRVVAVDPSVAKNPNDECGIVVIGASGQPRMIDRHAWILEDASMKGPPAEWTQRVVAMARKWSAPVVVEKNQGHQLLLDALHQIDPNLPILGVNSQFGKEIRADAVALLYQQGRVHHPGGAEGKFDLLEAQMLTWIPEITKKSPDRIDALVHGLTALLINPPKGFATGPVQAHSFADRQLPTAGRMRAPQHNSGQTFGAGRYSSGTLRLGGVDRKKSR